MATATVFFPASALAKNAIKPATDDNEFVIGIFPRRNAETTIQLFTPLAQYLEEKLGKPVKLVTTKDFESFWQGVESHHYDLVHYNQYHYVKSQKQQGYSVILKNEEFGEDTIAGSIVVRSDAGIKTISDLRDKKIVFGGNRSAMQSYIVATYLLRQAGLQAGDYIEAFSRNPPNAIFAAYYGQSSAGGTGDKVMKLPVVTKKIDTSKMIYLTVGDQLPHLPWAVRKNMPLSERHKVQEMLADLKNTRRGKQILASAKLTGLNVATDSDYDPHRTMILAVLNENYCTDDCSHNISKLPNRHNQPLVLGVFPRRPQDRTEQMFQPVVTYLQEKLGRPVVLKVSKDFENFWANIAEKQYDIVHLNQYQYIKSHKLYGYKIFAKNVENNSANIAPALIVSKDSLINSVADLKNKHIMFGGNKTAMVSYIAAVKLLENAGLTESDYIGSFTINPNNACRLVINQQADACAVASHFLDLPSVRNKLDVSKLKILTTGQQMPHLPWAIKGELDPQVAQEVQIALVSLINSPEGQAILNTAELTALRVAIDKEYNVYRDLIEEILNERY
ncbi:phosphate/phosphite/phosphonate ABC transporter substrate-binding protein [Kaarinaea lacus]